MTNEEFLLNLFDECVRGMELNIKILEKDVEVFNDYQKSIYGAQLIGYSWGLNAVKSTLRVYNKHVGVEIDEE